MGVWFLQTVEKRCQILFVLPRLLTPSFLRPNHFCRLAGKETRALKRIVRALSLNSSSVTERGLVLSHSFSSCLFFLDHVIVELTRCGQTINDPFPLLGSWCSASGWVAL